MFATGWAVKHYPPACPRWRHPPPLVARLHQQVCSPCRVLWSTLAHTLAHTRTHNGLVLGRIQGCVPSLEPNSCCGTPVWLCAGGDSGPTPSKPSAAPGRTGPATKRAGAPAAARTRPTSRPASTGDAAGTGASFGMCLSVRSLVCDVLNRTACLHAHLLVCAVWPWLVYSRCIIIPTRPCNSMRTPSPFTAVRLCSTRDDGGCGGTEAILP